MNLVFYTVIFLLAVVAAIIIMRLLFQFMNRPFRRIKDDQYLEQIAAALQLKKFEKAEAAPRS